VRPKKKLLVLPVTGLKKIGSVGRKKFFCKILLFIVLNFELLKVCITPFIVCNFALLHRNQVKDDMEMLHEM